MVRLTREVRFSVSANRAALTARPRSANGWAGWPAAATVGPFLRLRVTVIGQPDPATGYLCNITAIDAEIREQLVPLFVDLCGAGAPAPAPEDLLRRFWSTLSATRICGVSIDGLELAWTPFLRCSMNKQNPSVVMLTQQFEFSAAHRLHVPSLSPEENRAVFGKCNNPSGHGHNYVIDVTVARAVDGLQGVVIPLQQLERIVHEQVIERFDHKHLNQDTSEFRDLNPSVENIARVVFGLLETHVAPASLHCVRVYETPKTWAEVGPGAR